MIDLNILAPSLFLSIFLCMSLKFEAIETVYSNIFLVFRDLAFFTLIFIGVNIRYSPTGKIRIGLFLDNAS